MKKERTRDGSDDNGKVERVGEKGTQQSKLGKKTRVDRVGEKGTVVGLCGNSRLDRLSEKERKTGWVKRTKVARLGEKEISVELGKRRGRSSPECAGLPSWRRIYPDTHLELD